jgi:hypothetical protein
MIIDCRGHYTTAPAALAPGQSQMRAYQGGVNRFSSRSRRIHRQSAGDG